MGRDDRIRSFWNWLPHFRAIAETSHLPTAAARVHVTPPALSRTLKLLEEDLGHPLFHRRRGRLVLTADGKRLLQATRRAMHAVDDAERQLGSGVVAGPITIATGGVSVPLVVDALLHLRQQHPDLEPRLRTPNADAVVDQLWSGQIDVVISSFERRDDGLVTRTLGHERSSIYCGPEHPCYGRDDVPLSEVLEHPFVAPPPLPDGTGPEGWPADVPRQVGFQVDRMALGVDVCGRTALFAVLPDAQAASSPIPLHRVPSGDLIPDTPIIAIHIDAAGMVGRLVEEVERRVAL